MPTANRLPAGARPLAYDLYLRADPAWPCFEGRARIDVELDQALDAITLHARGLTFTTVAAEQGHRVEGIAVLDPDAQTATFRFPSPLAAGRAVLDLVWHAPVSKSMSGLYLSKDGPEECLVTQCEATDARAIFPCFDEPAFKATLKWTLTAPADLIALANGRLVGRIDGEAGWTTQRDGKAGWRTWEFEATPPISSYLAAIAVGRFASTPEVVDRGVPFRVWAMAGKERLGEEANAAAVRLRSWFEDYFAVPYQFAKYDQLAVPSFIFGAMENPGLIVFRATRLLMDLKTASWQTRRDITLVVAHEFAHQWFGNHVTMRWWDDLWLNEAFAEWIANRAVDELWPHYEIWTDFQARRTNRALTTDALRATHAIYQSVDTPEQAQELFDAITYGKGASVLRMLEGYLGAEKFRDGLRSYMRAFGRGNAAGPELWQHLGDAAREPVADMMRSWITQPGHPVLRVRLQGDRLRLSQQRFYSLPGAPRSNELWDIPMVIRFEKGAETRPIKHRLTAREGEVELPAGGALRWCHVNADDIGFYRTDPDDTLLAGLEANFEKLKLVERVGVLRDQWALALSGARPPERCFGLLAAAVPRQPHYAVVELAHEICREAERLLETHGDAAALAAYRAWVGRVFGPVLDAVGRDPRPGEPSATGLLRAAAYRAVAGIARERRALDAALGLATRERANPISVDANLAGTVVALAALEGDRARFDAHVKTYVDRRDSKQPPQEAERYLQSFKEFRTGDLVARALGLLEDGTVPKQAVAALLRDMLREPHSQDAAWHHVVRRWKALLEILGDAGMPLVVEALGWMPSAKQREVGDFLDANASKFVQSHKRAKDLLEERTAVFEQVVPGLASWARSASANVVVRLLRALRRLVARK